MTREEAIRQLKEYITPNGQAASFTDSQTRTTQVHRMS